MCYSLFNTVIAGITMLYQRWYNGHTSTLKHGWNMVVFESCDFNVDTTLRFQSWYNVEMWLKWGTCKISSQ